mmetsp:Transcript_28553/g.71876  ORF Transcript_28553/g.71876 Transcript_28553/m.71876 type:complete len:349 (-) Transcript_28553:700-1746(-)
MAPAVASSTPLLDFLRSSRQWFHRKQLPQALASRSTRHRHVLSQRVERPLPYAEHALSSPASLEGEVEQKGPGDGAHRVPLWRPGERVSEARHDQWELLQHRARLYVLNAARLVEEELEGQDRREHGHVQPADPATLQIVISAGEEDGDDEGAGDVSNKSVRVRVRELLKVHQHEDRDTRFLFGSRGRWSWRHSSHHHRADRKGETNTRVQKHESVTRHARRGGAAAVVPNGVGPHFTQEVRQRGRGHPRPPGINSCPRYCRGVRLPSAQRPARLVAQPCVSTKHLRQQLPHADDRDLRHPISEAFDDDEVREHVHQGRRCSPPELHLAKRPTRHEPIGRCLGCMRSR